MASYVPTELQAYGDLINPPSKSYTPTGELVGIYQGIPVYANKPIDPVYTGSDQDGNAYFIDKNTGAPISGSDDGSYHFNGGGGDDDVAGSQNLSGFDPSKLLSSATLGKVDWNYQSVQGGMGASGVNGVAINALWGGSYYPNGRVTNWADIDSTQKQANFTAGQTRDALWNVYDNLSAQGKTPAKNPDEIALQLAADNGATNYNSAGYIAGYGAGANTLGLAQTISAVFMNQPQVVSVTQHPYTVSPQSIADATTFGEAHSSPNVINTLNTFVKQGQNGPDYLGAALQAGALAVAGGALYAGALSGLGGATAAGLEAGTTVAATTAGIANTTLAAVGAGAAVGGISAAINGGDIVEGALKGAFASALGAVISPAAQELVKASNGAINLQVAQAAVQAAAVAAKAGLTGGDVTTAITNSLEGSAISAGMKDMNIPSNIAKIVTPIVVTGLNNGDVNAAIQNSLINYASGFVKSAISPSTTPSTPPAIASPAPDVGQPIATPLAEPTGGLPTNAPVVTAPEQPIVTQPVEPTSGLSAIPDTVQPVATPITDTASGLPVDIQPTTSPTDTVPATPPTDTVPAIDMSNAVFIATDPVTGTGVYILNGKLVNADGSAYTGDYSTTAPATTPTVEPTKPESTIPAETPTIPVDTTPVGALPVDTTPVDTPPVGALPVGALPVDTTPVDVQPTTPVGALPTDVQPIVTQPVEPTSGLSAIPDTVQPVATPITDTASGLPVDVQPISTQPVATPVADTSGGLPTTAPVAELTPEQQDKLNNTLASTDTNGITISGLSANTPLQVGGLRSGDKVISTTYGVDEDGNQTVRAVIETGDPSNRVQIYADYDALDLSKPYGFQPIQQGGDPNAVAVNGVLPSVNVIAYSNEPTFDKNGEIVGNSAPPDTPINNPPNGGLPPTDNPPTDNPPVDNPFIDVPILPVNPASGSGGLPTNGSPTPPSNDSGSTNETPLPNPPVNGSPTAPAVENAPPPSNGLPVENPSSGGTIPPDVPIPNPSSGGTPSTGSPTPSPSTGGSAPTPSTGTLNTAPVDAQGNQIENIKSGLTTLGDTVNANQNTTNTAIGDLSESTKVALANATAQEKSDFEKLNASQQASTIAATEQGVALSKAIEASQSNTESQIGNLSDTVASNQAKTNASLEGLSNEQQANFDAMTKAQQDAAIAQAGVNGSLSKSISNVQNGLDAQGNQIAGLTSTVSGLGTTVNGLGTQVGDLSSTVGGLGATVSGLGTALDNLSTADKANFATLSDAQKQLAVDEANSTGDLSKAIADVASSATSGLAGIASSVSGLGNTVSANQAATTASQQSLANQLLALQNQQKNNQLLTASQIIQPTEIMNKKQQYSGLYGGLPDATIKTPTETPFSYAPTKEAQLEDYAPVSQDFYHGGPVHYADGSGDEPVELSADAEQMKKLTDMVNAYVNKPSRKEEPIIHHNESMMEMHPLLRASMISAHERADPMYRGMPADMYAVHNTAHPFSGEMRKMANLHGYSPIMRTHQISGIHGYEDSENMSHGGQIDPKLLAILQKHFVPGPEGHLYQRHEERGFAVGGAGTGQSDDIPTMLSDGEYVVDADTVAALGDGSSKAGAEALDKMREAIRTHKRSAPADKIPPKAKSPLEYLKMSKGR